ncbi:hypothetical protein AMK59_2284, partial [Oryctes borbonicus]
VVLSASSRTLSDEEQLKLWREQTRVVNQFRCQPRPRSFQISDLHKALAHDDTIIPMEAVLHRCDHHSGCCHQKNHVCTENKSAVEIVKLAYFSSQQRRIITFNAKNHTSCICEESTGGSIK